MPTYTADFDYLLHASARVTHKLVIVEEEPLFSKHQANLTIYIERTNSGREHDGNRQYLQLKINDEIVYDNTSSCRVLGENSSDSVFNKTFTIDYDSNGTKHFKIEATYKSEKVSKFTDWIWGTIATAEISGSLTPIDLSAPTVSDISISADRYGRNAFVSFRVSHSSYELQIVEFKLKGLTEKQAKCRDLMYDNSPPAYVNQNFHGSKDGSYYIRLIRVSPIGQSLECYYPLDDGNDGVHPLESGQSYPYEIYAVTKNNVEIVVEGYLNVPQKVTGITCEPQLELYPGQTTELEWTVYPANAEERNIVFKTSDSTVATIDEKGKITAVSEGPCVINITTVDGGFTAECAVNVIDISVFPSLETTERYLTAKLLNKIIFATQFIKDELEEISTEISDYEIIYFMGRSEKVKNIFPILQAVKKNCEAIKSAAEAFGIETSELTEIEDIAKINYGWILVINNWISFLKEIHQRITEVKNA